LESLPYIGSTASYKVMRDQIVNETNKNQSPWFGMLLIFEYILIRYSINGK